VDSASKPSIRYVLITPARNEADYIENTISSVIHQTVLPHKWVIVNDGSTDGTGEILDKYQKIFPWIKIVRLEKDRERDFEAKVQAFNAGCTLLRGDCYDVIGNLDADITFDREYFEFLMEKFVEDDRLGVAGTPFVEKGLQYDYRFTNIEHVSGACQLFRRSCFEEIGGYLPNPAGGIDWIAVTTARMKGWKTRTFMDKTCIHHRPIGTGGATGLKVRFKQGQKDYFLGGHPLWQIFRSLYQMKSKPYLLGGSMLFLGYTSAYLTGSKRLISDELFRFNRFEQMKRLKRIFFGRQVARNL